MAELVWEGKYRDGARVTAPRAPIVLRTDEVHGGAPAAPGRATPPLSLSPAVPANRLILGDQARVLPALLEEHAGRVALVYVDPPFETGGDFDYRASIPGAPDGAARITVPAYSDARGLDAWLAWFHAASCDFRDLLEDGGSLYVHLDAHAAHYAKIILDEVFGPGAFQREIIWRIGWVSGFKSRVRNWVRNHDTLLFYAKGGRPRTFNKEYIPYPAGYLRRDGKAPTGAGHPLEDVWNASDVDRLDSIQIMSFSGEKVGYPTQKNEALVSRIVRASSEPGDLVLDAFVGSGTTAVVAEKLGRRWIACDASPIAIHAARKRLLRLSEVRPLVVQSVVAPPAEAGLGAASASAPGERLGVQLALDGRQATIALAAFAPPERAASAPPRQDVAHWSQWIDGWCIDWDHRGGALHAGSRVWRARGQVSLPLSASHAYGGAGTYVALVKAFDVLGGAATTTLTFEVSA